MNAPVKTGLRIGLASALALATAVPALAQSPYQPTDQYRRDVETYQREQDRYQDRREDYAESRADYRAARAEYDRKLAQWDRDQVRYDRRYGRGAYVRVYGVRPVWDEGRWTTASSNGDYRAARAEYDRKLAQWERDQIRYDRRYGRGAYVRVYGARPVWDESRWTTAYRDPRHDSSPVYADRYAIDSSYIERRCGNKSTVTAGVVGALLGAALGSNVAANGRGTEGAVLGAVVGGGIGAAVGNANDRSRCDNAGLYYSYNDTIPYREAEYDRARNSGRYNYSYYEQQGCRLASAPADRDGRDYRYVRVCPDREGRYRVTG
ncbi:glycine zipper domain-containing protein [Phenylobacterium immobile]|uniref:glycine zipper domain-containing protein n=1 Tax=Phenylobacterium immobile TaxID=21 RepID=UPI000AAA5D6C|nr:glycine zipper domain-containing protein [Phenylobacterium immobile]